MLCTFSKKRGFVARYRLWATGRLDKQLGIAGIGVSPQGQDAARKR
jgi:hypothetical protein